MANYRRSNRKVWGACVFFLVVVALVVAIAIGSSGFTNGNPKTWFNNWGQNTGDNDEDTAKYTLANGGFEDGLTGWTLSDNKLGGVSEETHYWVGDETVASGYAFGMDGKKMFSAYADGAEESATGTLSSSSFIVGGSGWITYKLGAAKNVDEVYLEIVDSSTGAALARFSNSEWAETTEDGTKCGCTLIAYRADLSAFKGKSVYIRITDNSVSDYGLFFCDSFVTYNAAVPSESKFVTATDILNQIESGENELPVTPVSSDDIGGWHLSWNDYL